MKIVIQRNSILIHTDFKLLHSFWIKRFLKAHASEMLFLPKSILVFATDKFQREREQFLRTLCRKYATFNDFDADFFLKTLLKLGDYSIKFIITDRIQSENFEAKVTAFDTSTVSIKLDNPNIWLMHYFHSRIGQYIRVSTAKYILFHLPDMRAKSRLERVFSKKHILHFRVKYNFDVYFLQRLYGEFSGFNANENILEHKTEDVNSKYYTILECAIGASKDEVKRSYKKLAKMYHPDLVTHSQPELVNDYTQKFQLLQEAYSILRSA